MTDTRGGTSQSDRRHDGWAVNSPCDEPEPRGPIDDGEEPVAGSAVPHRGELPHPSSTTTRWSAVWFACAEMVDVVNGTTPPRPLSVKAFTLITHRRNDVGSANGGIPEDPRDA